VNQRAASVRIRRASVADIPALHALIDISVRSLQAQDYSPAQIAGALGKVFGLDSQLIADGTHFVAEIICGTGKELVGCGGWSKRKTLFGSDRGFGREDNLLDPGSDKARIRAFFVHPEWALRGIGSQILAVCEEAARQAGFQAFELGATITGERMYRTRGYEAINRIEVPLENGVSLPIIRMSKSHLETNKH
jgi:N-acetylglutamate synthase-like GNAT family acetyltransferase